MNIQATYRSTNVQGTRCYFPALKVTDGEYKNIYISRGDPLVNKADAIKYANIWRNDTISAGYVTYF